jgi:tetratricopeptide (TPR) repeat protein
MAIPCCGLACKLPVSEKRLARNLDRFLAARNWARAFKVLGRHPELVEEQADALLGALIEQERVAGSTSYADQLAYLRTVLRRCRVLGPQRVFRELTVEEDESVISVMRNATAAYRRYHSDGDLGGVEAAIRGFEATAELAQAIPTRVTALSNLGMALLTRADYYGSASDVERAVAVAEEAVSNTPPDDEDRPAFVSNLALALLNRHDQGPDPVALDRAIDLLSATAGAGNDDAVRGNLMLNLASARYARFNLSGSGEDLDAGIGLLAEAVRLPLADEAERARALNNLGVMLSERYRRAGRVEDLSDAISALEQSIGLAARTSPERPAKLGHLAGVYVDRYARSGAITDLDQACELLAEAGRVTPADSAESADRDCDLGTVMVTSLTWTKQWRCMQAQPKRRGQILLACRCTLTSSAPACGCGPGGSPTRPKQLVRCGPTTGRCG